MGFEDISARMKKIAPGGGAAKGKAPAKAPDPAESFRLRAKMLGVLLTDARRSAERTIEDCAYLLRVTPEQFQAWEYGEDAPSLPQMELLAYYLGVPISHFWGTETLEAKQGVHVDIQTEYMALRTRMIGVMLHAAREEMGLSLDDISQSTSIPRDKIEWYEQGETAIPMHELTVLAGALKKNTNYFLESSGYIGQWLTSREEWKNFSALPEEKRRFAANPRNVGFLEIAIMLSKMPVENLREVGASILDITR
jgi:transcriptional regulator with XRE-family HTH domain